MSDGISAPLAIARRLATSYLGERRRFTPGDTAVAHSERVGARFRELAAGHLESKVIEEGAVVALLHDTIEDGADHGPNPPLGSLVPEQVRAEIQGQLGISTLVAVEHLTVSPALPHEKRFAEFKRRAPAWDVVTCLLKWADLHDNALTRDRLPSATEQRMWSEYALEMFGLIRQRLLAMSWRGELPPAQLPDCAPPTLVEP